MLSVNIVFLLVVELFEIYRFIMKIFTHIPHNRWGLQCLPLQQNNFFFTHWLFIAQQCNILLASCSHNSLSKMVVVLSRYCCCHVAFIANPSSQLKLMLTQVFFEWSEVTHRMKPSRRLPCQNNFLS